MAGSPEESDSDSELTRAIKLSLADNNRVHQDDVIEVSSDESDGDEDLKRAIALSLDHADSTTECNTKGDSSDDEDDLNKTPKYRPQKEKGGSRDSAIRGTAQEQPDSSQTKVAPHTPSGDILGLPGIDRKKMEEERLARLAAKRKVPDSEQESQGRQSKLRTELTPQRSANLKTKAPESPRSNALYFPKGAVKKTYALGHPRTGDDIKIEEIFQKDDLELAVLSSFQWDERWMMSKIDMRRTNVCLIAFASNKQQQEEMKANACGGAIKFCFPQTNGIGSMHSKLQLLKFANHLRIVVPTGNLVPYDWGETGVMENMVFIIDLPIIQDPKRRAANVLTPFGEELTFFLKCQGLESSLIKSLEKYDFSETSRYAFIHTIGTTCTGDDWKRTGYCGLGRAVSTLGLQTTDPIELDYVISSLGSVNHDLITALYYAAHGDDGLKEYCERAGRGKKVKTSSAEAALGQINEHFRIYFPSRQSVVQSHGGKQAAGTICAQSKWWDSDSFPRQLVHDSQNVRSGLLTHTKLMLVRSKPSMTSPVAWAYVGSANLSESAWGRLTRDKQTGNPKLTCRNWECGVLVSIAGANDHSDSRGSANQTAPSDLSVFLGSIPVPIIWPSEPYGSTAAKRPWLFLDDQ